MKFIYFIAETLFDGKTEKQISKADVLRTITVSEIKGLHDGKSFQTANGVIWAEEA